MSRYHSAYAYDERDPRNDDGSPRTEGELVGWEEALARFEEAKALLDAEARASTWIEWVPVCKLCDATGRIKVQTVPHDAFIRCPCLPAALEADSPDGTMSELLEQMRRT